MNRRVHLDRIAGAAIAGSLLLFGSVAAELVHPVQAPDGTSREPVLHSLYLVTWIVGWILIAVATAGLRSAAVERGGASRAVAAGAWLSIGGALCFALSTLGALLGVALGVYLEVMFLLFLVAFALLIPGQLLLAAGRRRLPAAPASAGLLVVAAIGLVVALATDQDPFHDLGLLVFDVAWLSIGVALLRAAAAEQPATGSLATGR